MNNRTRQFQQIVSCAFTVLLLSPMLFQAQSSSPSSAELLGKVGGFLTGNRLGRGDRTSTRELPAATRAGTGTNASTAIDKWSGLWDVNLVVPNAIYQLRWEVRPGATGWQIRQTIVSTNNQANQHSVGFSYDASLEVRPDGTFRFSSVSPGVRPGGYGYFEQVADCKLDRDRVTCVGSQRDNANSYGISMAGLKQSAGLPTN